MPRIAVGAIPRPHVSIRTLDGPPVHGIEFDEFRERADVIGDRSALFDGEQLHESARVSITLTQSADGPDRPHLAAVVVIEHSQQEGGQVVAESLSV